MNDLRQYEAVKHLMRPGDLIAFWGTGLLSSAIRFFGGGGPSHVAVVRQGVHQSDDVKITESTIHNKKNGVQTNDLGERLSTYDKGGSAAWLPLADAARDRIDWKRFYEFAGAAQDHVQYGVMELGEFLVRMVPGLGSRICQSEDKNKMVCTAWVCAWWKYSGLLYGVNFEKVTPQDLVEMSHYSSNVPILGKPPAIRGFNSK